MKLIKLTVILLVLSLLVGCSNITKGKIDKIKNQFTALTEIQITQVISIEPKGTRYLLTIETTAGNYFIYADANLDITGFKPFNAVEWKP